MIQSKSESLEELIVVLVLSILLVSGLLLWRPWSSATNTWRIVVPRQPSIAVPENAAPAPDPNNVLT